MQKYLVGYVSKNGTTKEIAQKIGSILKENNFDTDILSLEEIKNIDQYSGIILGTPVYGMKLLPEFSVFVEENKNIKNITGFFVVSYLFEVGRKMWKNAIQKDIDRFKSILIPQSTAIFAGGISKKMPGFANFLFGLPKGLPLDNRNWKQIEEWANEIINKIKSK